MSRRTPFAATVVALPLALAGCGLGPSIAGLHPAPAESSGGASISRAGAADVAASVLDRAAAVREDDTVGAAKRTEVFTGPALRAAEAAAESRDEQSHSGGEVEQLQVLAVSRGTEWPRTVLATSLDDGVQFLHVLVATAPDEPYRLFADVPMAAGASVPALPPLAQGAPVTIAEDPGQEVTAAVEAWAKGVSYPPPDTAPKGVSFDDAFSTALQENAQQEEKDLDDVATYRQKQSTADGASASIELAAGGHLAFVPMTRTDTITAGDRLKKLKIKDKAIRRVLDADAITERLTIRHAETLAVVVPPEGEATVVGVSDVLASAKGE